MRILLLLTMLISQDYVAVDSSYTRCLDKAKDASEVHLCEVKHPKTVVCIAMSEMTDLAIADCIIDGEE